MIKIGKFYFQPIINFLISCFFFNTIITIKVTKKNKYICNKSEEFQRCYSKCYPEIEDESLLDNEIIDVLIKYIDLSDENLHREKIYIEKDYQILKKILKMVKLNIVFVQF